MNDIAMANTSLPPVKQLLKESFETFKLIWVRFLLLLLAFLGVGLLSFILFILLNFVLIMLHSPITTVIVTIVSIGYGLLIFLLMGWASSSLILLLNEPKAHSIKEVLKLGFPFAVPYFLLTLLSILLTFPTFLLLLIPGILISILFSFARYELVIGGKGVLFSLRRSVYVVKSHFVPIFLRMLLIIIISITINIIVSHLVQLLNNTFIGVIITLSVSFLFSCFSFCYSIILYKQAEAATLEKEKGSKLRWILIADLISVVVAVFIGIAIFNFINSAYFKNILKTASSNNANSTSVSLEKAVYRASFIASCKTKGDEKYCTCVADSLVNNNTIDQLKQISNNYTDTKVVPRQLDKAIKSCTPK